MKQSQIVILLGLVIALSGCADSVSFEEAGQIEPVGFLYGLWHGVLFPFSVIAALFDDSISVYAIYNNGGWYDFGFYLGISSLSATSVSINKKH